MRRPRCSVFIATSLDGFIARRDGGIDWLSIVETHLIDDITLSIVPVLLGDGIRLFDEPVPERRLRLTASQAFASGLVQVKYERALPYTA